MANKISRRDVFTGALAAGLAASPISRVSAQENSAPKRLGLPDVWGEDFLYQWSPPEHVERDITPGSSPIRLSSSNAHFENREGQDYDELFASMRARGWSACEGASVNWASRKVPEAELREMKAALQKHDVLFYGLHCGGNIIAPDPDADRWQRHIVDSIHTAEEFDCRLVLTHAGSMYPNRNVAHPKNWSREAWERSVNALKRICKDTAGSNVKIAIEAVNTESINNPWAHVRLREDVGDERITVGLDITNMVYPGVAFRMTELLNTTFDLLEDQISYVHAKDFEWNEMLPGINWAMNGTGNMDYETFLARVSRLKTPPTMLVEFLNEEAEFQQAQSNIRAIAKKIGVQIYG